MPPLRCTLPLTSQDRKIQGTRAEPLWKAIQRSSGPIEADRTAALPESAQGATPTRTLDTQRRNAAASPSSKKTKSQSLPAKPKDDMTSEGSAIADLIAMVQQLRLENRRLEDQLVERKIKVEELRDNLRLLRRGLGAKMKHLFEAMGHKDLY